MSCVHAGEAICPCRAQARGRVPPHVCTGMGMGTCLPLSRAHACTAQADAIRGRLAEAGLLEGGGGGLLVVSTVDAFMEAIPLTWIAVAVFIGGVAYSYIKQKRS